MAVAVGVGVEVGVGDMYGVDVNVGFGVIDAVNAGISVRDGEGVGVLVEMAAAVIGIRLPAISPNLFLTVTRNDLPISFEVSP